MNIIVMTEPKPRNSVMMNTDDPRQTVSAPIMCSEDDILGGSVRSVTEAMGLQQEHSNANEKSAAAQPPEKARAARSKASPGSVDRSVSQRGQEPDRSMTSSKMRRCASMPTTLFDIKSIMRFRTVDESLHSSYDTQPSAGRGRIKFDKVKIREYNRTIGDNPSCSSGPPVSIGWKYNVIGDISVDVYETTRPPRRSHFEMVLPRKVRYDMLKRDWDVRQKDIADAVRRNVKTKNQRKATVNNLNKASKMEEAMESAGRKLKRFMLLQKPVSQQVKDLDDKFIAAEKKRKQRLFELQMASELSVASSHTKQGDTSAPSVDDAEEEYDESMMDISTRTA